MSSPPSFSVANVILPIGVGLTMPKNVELSRLSPGCTIVTLPSELPALSNASTSTT